MDFNSSVRSFYILLRGTVSIYINNTIADEEEGAEACVKEDTYTAQGELDRTKFGNWIAKIGRYICTTHVVG